MTGDELERGLWREALAPFLQDNFPGIEADTLRDVLDSVQWQRLQGGEVLMAQGEAGDAAYLTVSGRLRVYVDVEGRGTRTVRELGRGELTGEMSLYTDAPRSATVVAIRASVVARLDKAQFRALVARHPQVSIALTRKIIERLQTQDQQRPLPPPVTVTILPISEGVDAAAFAQRLLQALAPHGRACLVDAADVRSRAGVDEEDAGAPASRFGQSVVLQDLEAEHDFVLMVADTQPGEWTRLCLEESDEILLLADATQAPQLHALERAYLLHGDRRHEAAETLVLMHPVDTRSPRGMRHWVDRRPVTGHVNLRPLLASDMARLARLISRNAVGLVLAGGGARGFAHLGVWKALVERGIEVDCVGGTSMGAVMAAAIATDQPMEHTLRVVREAFKVNPTGDYSLLPMISLIKGQRVRSIVERSIQALTGAPVDIVDLWKGYFCIASNYSRGCETVWNKGDLGRSLRSSIAIPGALPPVVIDGELYSDGGTFNNFPADVMRAQRGVGKVVGVDLSARSARRLDFDEMPSAWQVLRDRWRSREKRRYRVPSLVAYLLNISILYSVSRQEESRRRTDLYFNPPLANFGFLQWNRASAIIQRGDAHAAEVIEALSSADKQAWGIRGQ
jgi:NTE family protein